MFMNESMGRQFSLLKNAEVPDGSLWTLRVGILNYTKEAGQGLRASPASLSQRETGLPCCPVSDLLPQLLQWGTELASLRKQPEEAEGQKAAGKTRRKHH